MNAAVKGAFLSRAMWLSALLAALGYLDQNQSVLVSYFPQHWQSMAMIGFGAGFAVIRVLTSKSLADKGTPQ
jgi:hypothetical protein